MTGLERTVRALSGAVVVPPACGATFVPPEALPGAGAGPASAFARAFTEARLDFAFVASWEPWASALAAELREAGIAVLWAVPGVFSAALSSLGYSTGLRAVGRDPAALTSALDEAEAAMLQAAGEGAAVGAGAIVVADDLAGPSGTLAAPEYLTEHVLPRLARAAAGARRAGVRAVLHSDGDVSLVLHEIARSGFAGVHVGGVSDEAFERLFGLAHAEGLAVVGGLGAQTLARGLAASVGTGTRLAQLARSGALLVSDDGGITTPKEYSALMAAFSAARGRL